MATLVCSRQDLVPAGGLELVARAAAPCRLPKPLPHATRPRPLPPAVCHPAPLTYAARERGFRRLAAEEGEEERGKDRKGRKRKEKRKEKMKGKGKEKKREKKEMN
jgi:hypothetical protein